jgi:hypothetical protein
MTEPCEPTAVERADHRPGAGQSAGHGTIERLGFARGRA